jgi:hypothetical protein
MPTTFVVVATEAGDGLGGDVVGDPAEQAAHGAHAVGAGEGVTFVADV